MKFGDCFPYVKNGYNVKQDKSMAGIPITRIETLSGNAFNREKMGYANIFSIDGIEDRVLRDGDILMSHINSLQYLGRAVMYREQPGDCFIHGMNLLRLVADKSVVEPAYAEAFFQSPSFKRSVSRIAKKSVNQASFSTSSLKQIKIPLPNLEQQRQISGCFESIACELAFCRKQANKLDDLVKSRFNEMFGCPRDNTKGWRIRPLGAVCDTRLGKMLDKKKQSGTELRPYLANTNVQWFKFDLSDLNQMDFSAADRIEFELQNGDVLVTEGGEVGRCAIWKCELKECYFQKAIHRIRCHLDSLIPEYLVWAFKAKADYNLFKNYTSQSTIAHLTGAKIKQVPLQLPPLVLQQEFADFVTQVDKLRFARACLIRNFSSHHGKIP